MFNATILENDRCKSINKYIFKDISQLILNERLTIKTYYDYFFNLSKFLVRYKYFLVKTSIPISKFISVSN